jgi:hypothetical protein
MSAAVIIEVVALLVGREVLECFFDFKNKSTPGRLSSSAHGLFVLALIAQNQWKDAMESTVLYFFYDLLFTIKYSTPEDFYTLKTVSIILHHILGFSLCFYSALTESYSEHHLGAKVTRALLMLEICNPVLHFAMIFQNELPEINSTYTFLSSGIKCAMLANYFYVRVWALGNALLVNEDDKTLIEFYSQFPTSLFFLFAIIMWVLQFLWFLYMAMGMMKVMKCFTPESFDKEN